MTELPGPDEAVFHLTTPARWAEARTAGVLVPDGFDREGFVHCSTGAQLPSTIERHFPHEPELVLLRLIVERVAPELRWEESRPGQLFPHLYRPLLVSDVSDATHWKRD